MAWRFRRSLKFGLFRLNFSKSGIGYSAGVRGFRIGKTAKGTSYTAASIPGTGIYNRQYASKGKATAQSADSPTDGSTTSAPQQAGTGNGISRLIAFLAGAWWWQSLRRWCPARLSLHQLLSLRHQRRRLRQSCSLRLNQ